MNERIKELLIRPGLERLNDWVSIGPVQRAALEEFTELVVLECARVHREMLAALHEEVRKALAESTLREKNT